MGRSCHLESCGASIHSSQRLGIFSHKTAPSFAFPSFLLFLAHLDQLRPLLRMDKFIAVFAYAIKVYVVSPYVTSSLAPALFQRFWLSEDGDIGTLSRRERIELCALDWTLSFLGGVILWGFLSVLWFMYTQARSRFGRP